MSKEINEDTKRRKAIKVLNDNGWSEVEVQREKDAIFLILNSEEKENKVFKFSAHLLRIAIYKKERRYPYSNIDTRNFSLDLARNGNGKAILFFESEEVILPFKELYNTLKDQLRPEETLRK